MDILRQYRTIFFCAVLPQKYVLYFSIFCLIQCIINTAVCKEKRMRNPASTRTLCLRKMGWIHCASQAVRSSRYRSSERLPLLCGNVPGTEPSISMTPLFYEYVQQNRESNYDVPWSVWLEEQGAQLLAAQNTGAAGQQPGVQYRFFSKKRELKRPVNWAS